METGKDFCLDCGRFVKSKSWGRGCEDEQHQAVHIGTCKFCKSPIGYIIDDDYCAPEILVCPVCLVKKGYL